MSIDKYRNVLKKYTVFPHWEGYTIRQLQDFQELLNEGNVIPQEDGKTLHFLPFVFERHTDDWGVAIYRLRDIGDFTPEQIGMSGYEIRKLSEEEMAERGGN
jgi:hypothetical protein